MKFVGKNKEEEKKERRKAGKEERSPRCAGRFRQSGGREGAVDN